MRSQNRHSSSSSKKVLLRGVPCTRRQFVEAVASGAIALVVLPDLLKDTKDTPDIAKTTMAELARATAPDATSLQASDNRVSDLMLTDDSVVVEGAYALLHTYDLDLDKPSRRKPYNTNKRRRALVHNFGDGLTINWGHDYMWGVEILGDLFVPDGITTNEIWIKPTEAVTRSVNWEPNPPFPTGENTWEMENPMRPLGDRFSVSSVLQDLERRVRVLEQRIRELEQQ